QAVLGLDTTAGDAGDDAALAQGQTEVTVVVTLVGMELVRSATGPAPARHPAPTRHLGRQVLPGDARLQHEQDPVSAARSDTRGRPPLGFGGSGGSRGAIRAHNASGNSSFAMAHSSMAPILLPWLLTRRFC